MGPARFADAEVVGDAVGRTLAASGLVGRGFCASCSTLLALGFLVMADGKLKLAG